MPSSMKQFEYEIEVPENCMGDVVGSLNRCGAILLGLEKVKESEFQAIKVRMENKEMFSFQQWLKTFKFKSVVKIKS